jgi:thiamine pyrophosphate-dependent acetolactate synthase large subunit-like protein
VKVGIAIAEILKREGIAVVCGYPLNFLIDYAAAADIRPVITRAERIAGHMADAISRVTSGKMIGVYLTQHGPGIENGMGAVAVAYSESIPMLVMPMGYLRSDMFVAPHFNSSVSLRSFTKSVEPILSGRDVPAIMRRAFSRLRNGRGGPVVVEIPADVWHEEVPEPLDYTPVTATRYGPDPVDIRRAAQLLLAAKRPVIHAGQGVHFAQAWPQLQRLAETLAIPVCTSLQGKSAFPETHELALGAAGLTMPRPVHHFLEHADLVFGIGCSFTKTTFGARIPRNRTVIHATLDPAHLDNETPVTVALIGDAALTLEALQTEVDRLLGGQRRDRAAVAAEIRSIFDPWLAEWLPKLTSSESPMTPYRVIWDLYNTVDVANTVITHDAGSPRDQLAPFWKCTTPLSYLGWGKTTHLGYGLGLAMGAKLVHPEKLCINVWGDAAIGFTGMDFETCVRERIPVLSILFNNFCMAMETPVMGVSQRKYGTTNISGDYAAMARAFGGYGERVTDPADIVAAIRRGMEQTRQGVPALLEFITCKELASSRMNKSFYVPALPPIDENSGKPPAHS